MRRAHGLENVGAHSALYAIAFVQGDEVAMKRHAEWAAGKPGESGMLVTRAIAAAFGGKVGRFRELYRRSIRLDPDSITTRMLLAIMLQESGSLKEAATIVDDVVRRDPDNTRARALQGSIRKAAGGS